MILPKISKYCKKNCSLSAQHRKPRCPPMHTYYNIPTVLTKTKHSIFITGMSELALVTESKMLCANLKSLVKTFFIVHFINSRGVRNVPLAC